MQQGVQTRATCKRIAYSTHQRLSHKNFWRLTNLWIHYYGDRLRCFNAVRRVSMGLTDRRKTAKNLVDNRKNWKISTFAVNRVKRVNRKRNFSLDFLVLRKVLNSPLTGWDFLISRLLWLLTLSPPQKLLCLCRREVAGRKKKKARAGHESCLTSLGLRFIGQVDSATYIND